MKNKILLCILLFIVYLTSTKAESMTSTKAKSNYHVKYKKRPLNLNIQYAGNLGLVSAGVGKTYLMDKLNVSLVYGYLPKMVNGTEVHSLGIKSSYDIAYTNISSRTDINYYTGLNAFYGIARNTYFDYPGYYPKGYYTTNAIHSSLFVGSRLNIKVSHPKAESVSLFTEFGTLSHQLWLSLSTKQVRFFDILNFSAGISIRL